MALAIRVENLSKQYRLGLTHAGSIRELVNRAAARLRGKTDERLPHELTRAHADGRQVAPDGTFWALKDVSFEVNEGDVVGIVGRNGAGKSTLLKILSRITAPTRGRVELYGRVASLLEVGTGFHPELTGRENIFLNGAILGMTRAEVKRKFDEIVAFAEIETFIDTPVKRYSSGMYVRLAFAVAAHLEPEILIVDEVLAVGDLAFQAKCLGRMAAVASGGRTVLFISHNTQAVSQLCSRGIYLLQGEIAHDGGAKSAIEAYLSALNASQQEIEGENVALEVTVLNGDGTSAVQWAPHEDIQVDVHVRSKEKLVNPAVDLAMYTEGGIRVFAVQSDLVSTELADRSLNEFHVLFRLTNVGLTCQLVHFDVGLRAIGDHRYRALWRQVFALPVVSQGLRQPCRSPALIVLPHAVTVLADENTPRLLRGNASSTS